MAFGKGDFSYEIVDNFDKVFDEKGNSMLSLRKIKWGESDSVKLDLRKWYNTANGETVGKGFSFLTEEGPHELAKVLVENGYGYTKDIVNAIKTRKDFKQVMESVASDIDISGLEVEEDSADYYDPKDILL